MPEPSDNLHVFYRFTVPGVAFTTWAFLMVPSAFVLRTVNSQSGAAILVSVLVGASLVVGWLAYFSIYPLWRSFLGASFLEGLRLYPKSSIFADLATMLKQKRIEWTPEHVWSYFLWNCCPADLRQRIKNLADYGHSLYLVACCFILMPILLTIALLVRGQYSVFSWLTARVASADPSMLATSEAVVIVLALLLGCYLLAQGRKRISYAQNLQGMLMREQKTRLDQMLNLMAPTNSN